MPAVDIFTVAPNSVGPAAEAAPERFQADAGRDQNFGQMMQQALATPESKKTADKNHPRPVRPGGVPVKNIAAGATTADTVSEKNSATSANPQKPAAKDAAATPEKTPSAANLILPALPPEPAAAPATLFFSPLLLPAAPFAAGGKVAGATTNSTNAAGLVPSEKNSAAKTVWPEAPTGLVKTPAAGEKNFPPRGLDAGAPPAAATEEKTLTAPAGAGAPEVAKALEKQGNSALPPEMKTVAATPAAGPEAALLHAADKAGTGVATMAVPMKKTENTNKVAGGDVKVLPGGAAASATENILPPQLTVAPAHAAERSADNLNFSFSQPGTPTTNSTTPANSVVLPSLADARLKPVERTHDMVALHAMRLVESNSDVLSVIIKPAVGTELSLELRERNGAVSAQAVLQRGDFQLLNQHWPELQQKLELRGIKLAPLGGEANFSADTGGFQPPAHPAGADEAQEAAAFAEFAAAGGGATARYAADLVGWESWA